METECGEWACLLHILFIYRVFVASGIQSTLLTQNFCLLLSRVLWITSNFRDAAENGIYFEKQDMKYAPTQHKGKMFLRKLLNYYKKTTQDMIEWY